MRARLTRPPIAAIDYDEAILRWMDHFLRGMNNGVEREKPVRYFAMGDNQWRDADTWPPPAQPTSYYLAPARGKRGGGLVTETPKPDAQTATLFSDPEHPVINKYRSSGGHDYRYLEKRKDILTFDSAPLEHDTEITGPTHPCVSY